MNFYVASRIVLLVVCVILVVATAVLLIRSSDFVSCTRREERFEEDENEKKDTYTDTGDEEEEEGEDDDSIDVDVSQPVGEEEDVLNFRGKDVVKKEDPIASKIKGADQGSCTIKGVPMLRGWIRKSGDPDACAVDLSAVQHHCDKRNRRFYVPGVVKDMHIDPVSGACDVSFDPELKEQTVANYKKLVDVLEPKRKFIARTLEEIEALKEVIEEQKERQQRLRELIEKREKEYRDAKAKWRKLIAEYKRVKFLEGAASSKGTDNYYVFTDDNGNSFDVFVFTQTSKDAEFEVTNSGRFDVLVVGGGGAGGQNHGSGGGAGGVLAMSDVILPAGKYMVRVGKGGKPHDDPEVKAANGEAGEDSRFGPFVAYGGGGGNGKSYRKRVRAYHWLWRHVAGINRYKYERVRTGGAGNSGGSGGGGGGIGIQGRLDTYIEDGPAAVIYEHPNYQGNSLELHNLQRYDLYDLQQSGFSNDTLSSVAVRPGVRVTLYEHMNMKGAAIPLESSMPDLRYIDGFDNVTSSILVEKTDRRSGTVPKGTWIKELGNDGEPIMSTDSDQGAGGGGSYDKGSGWIGGEGIEVSQLFGEGVGHGYRRITGKDETKRYVAYGGYGRPFRNPLGLVERAGGGGDGIEKGERGGGGGTGLVVVRRLRGEYKATKEKGKRRL